MPILVLSDTLDALRSTEVALDIVARTKKVVVCLNDEEAYERVLEACQKREELRIEKVVVIAFSQPTVVKWDKFVNDHHLYESGVPIEWITPHH